MFLEMEPSMEPMADCYDFLPSRTGPDDPSSPDPVSRDGFEAYKVQMPDYFLTLSGKEEEEAIDFLHKLTIRHRLECRKCQLLGEKRKDLEERIARSEKRIRRYGCNPMYWENNGLAKVAPIPRCVRYYMRDLKRRQVAEIKARDEEEACLRAEFLEAEAREGPDLAVAKGETAHDSDDLL